MYQFCNAFCNDFQSSVDDYYVIIALTIRRKRCCATICQENELLLPIPLIRNRPTVID